MILIYEAIRSGLMSVQVFREYGARIGQQIITGLFQSLDQTMQGLSRIAAGMFDGINNVVSEFFGIFQDLANTGFQTLINVLGAVQSIAPLIVGAGAVAGGTGAAAAGAVGGGAGAAAAGAAVGTAGGAAGAAAGGAAAGAAGGAAGAVAGGAGGAAAGATAGVAGVVALSTISVMVPLVQGILNASGRLTQAVGAFLRALGEIASGIAQIMLDSVQAAQRVAGDMLTVRNNTGMSSRDAFATYFNFRAVGISGDTIASMFQDPMRSPFIFGGMARAMGLPDYRDPDFAIRLAQQQQNESLSGPSGPIRARLQLRVMGMDNPEMIRMVNTPIPHLRAEQRWATQTMNGLQLSPELIARIGDRMTLLIRRFEVFADLFRTKITQQLLPILEGLLDRASNYLARNSVRIGQAINAGMEWTYAVLPKLVLQAGATVMHTIAGWMYALAQPFVNFRNGQGLIYTVLNAVVTLWDYMVNGIRTFYASARFVFEQLRYDIVNSLPTNWGIRSRAQNLLQPMTQQQLQLGPQQFMNVIPPPQGAAWLRGLQQSNLINWPANTFTNLGNMFRGYGNNLDQMNRDLGTYDQRRQYYQNISKSLGAIERHTNIMANAFGGSTNGMPMAEFHTRAYVEAILVQSMRRSMTR